MSDWSDQVAAAAEAAYTTVAAIADDIENDFAGVLSRNRRSGLRRQARRLRAALAALEAEASMLSAGVCEHRLGDDHANPYCGRDGKPL